MSNLTPKTNTGERCISISTIKKAYTVSIKTPDDGMKYRSIGYAKIGKPSALKLAIKVRDTLGVELWGKKCWKLILNDPRIFHRLPESLEPVSRMSEFGVLDYFAQKITFDSDGNKQFEMRMFSAKKYGKLGAYSKAKRAKLNMYQDILPILQAMKRFTVVNHA